MYKGAEFKVGVASGGRSFKVEEFQRGGV